MSETQTADHALIRKLNKAIILDVLRRLAPLSRAEVAAHTGLNRSTVSIIINSLIEEGFVQETDLQSARVGRPGMQLVLNPQGGFAVGMEIGVDYVSVLLTDFTAQEIWREHILSDPEDDQSRILERGGEPDSTGIRSRPCIGAAPAWNWGRRAWVGGYGARQVGLCAQPAVGKCPPADNVGPAV